MLRLLLPIAMMAAIVASCRKSIDNTSDHSVHKTVSSDMIVDTYAAPPLHIDVIPKEDYDYYTTEELAEYIYVSQGYNALLPYSYTYTPRYRSYYNGNGTYSYLPDIRVDYESQQLRQALDVKNYLRCFDALSDMNATCTMELFVDLPVDNNPNTFFDWSDGYPGHAFMRLSKSNGTQTITRNIGFYPKEGWKTLISNGPIAAKFVDNSNHEYNASMKMTVTASSFRTVISSMKTLATTAVYDLDDYNCVNFAVDMFNSVRAKDKIEVPKVYYIGSPKLMSSPQGLYLELLRRSKLLPANTAINIVSGKNYVAANKGTCP